MNKAKILWLVLVLIAVIAGIWVTISISQKSQPQPATTDQPARAIAAKDQDTLAQKNNMTSDAISLKISSFQKKPSLTTLTAVENEIRSQLPLLNIADRYKLLDKWEKALIPFISRLDPEQGKLLSAYGATIYNPVEGESVTDTKKKFDNDFTASLEASQKSLLHQLTAHRIEITTEEEVGPVFSLKPLYWKELFASSLPESDQKFWDQKAFENDPVIDFDAGLAVDRITLGEWAFAWEQYLKKYPGSHYQNQAKENYRSYMSYLLGGLENTATLNTENNSIEPDVDADFDTIIKHHPNSTVANSIIAFRKKVKEAGGQNNLQSNLYNLINSILKNTR